MAAALRALVDVLGIDVGLCLGHSAGAAIATSMVLDGSIAPRVLPAINGAFFPLSGLAGLTFPLVARAMATTRAAPALFAWRASERSAVERQQPPGGRLVAGRRVAREHQDDVAGQPAVADVERTGGGGEGAAPPQDPHPVRCAGERLELARDGPGGSADRPWPRQLPVTVQAPARQPAVGRQHVVAERRGRQHPGGDHTMFVGEIVAAGFEEGAEPLIWYGSGYRRLQPGD